MDLHSRDQTSAQTKAPSPQTVSSGAQERYRLETSFLAEKLGSLSQIRRELGLSQRKISELFLVDPASWNRWERKGRAPGYIYKSIQWFLALRQRNPEMASLAWLKTHSQESYHHSYERELEELKREVSELKAQRFQQSAPPQNMQELKPSRWPLAFIALGVALGFGLARLF